MRLLFVVLTVAAVALPAAAQLEAPGSVVDVTAARHAPVVVVDHPFAVSVDVANKATEAKQVQLYSFLYRDEEGRTCGSQSDERFLGPADRSARPAFSIPPGATVSYPFAGGLPWYHEANASQVAVPGAYQLCVFALNPEASTITYYDAHPSPIAIRVTNGLPRVDFSWSPEPGNVTTEYLFTAEVGDDPDGDPVKVSWDFGHLSAKGQATGEGREIRHTFYHVAPQPKTFVVTLTVDDGFDRVATTHEVTVLPENAPAPQGPEPPAPEASWLTRLLPAPAFALTSAVALLAARLARRRRG